MKLVRTALTILAIFGLATVGAYAQGTGGLIVTVVDSSGATLPGATVTISHETGNIKPYSSLTNAKGVAEFPVLRPGPGYIVEVSFPGFGARRETGIRVPIGNVQQLPISLAEEMQERVRVVATENVVELEKTSSSTKFSDEFVQDLPVPGRFYQNVLTLAPGVNDPDGDGNPTVHGSRSRDFKAVVSGVSNVDPLTGQFMSLVNADSIEEMEVITGGASVEFGRAQGGFARIIQKQGTNEFEGTFSFLYRSSKLDGTGSQDLSNLPDPEFDELHPSFQFSGPIIKDKLWYRLSHQWINRGIPINTTQGITVQTDNEQIHADQITWQISPRNKLAFQYQSDPLLVNNFGVSSTQGPEASQKIDTQSETMSLTWTAPYSPKLLVETTIASQDLESGLSPSTEGILNNCVAGDPFLEDAQCTNFQTQETSGSHFLTNLTNSQRFTLNSQATLYGGQFWGANHQFKFGFTVENERFFRSLERRANIGFFVLNPINDPDDENMTPEEILVISATLGVPGESRTRATGTNWAFYLEDQIKPLNNLVVTLGLRVDREEIHSDGLKPFDPEAESVAYLDALENSPETQTILLQNAFTAYEGVNDFVTELSNATGLLESQIFGSLASITRQSKFWNKTRTSENFNIGNTNYSPAISVSWDPWSNGKNKFAASARRYYDKIFLNVPLTELNPATTTLLFNAEGTDLDGDGVSDRVSPTGLRNNVNPAVNINAVDRELATPYQDEWRILYERELFTETSLRIEYINRKFRDQLQNVDLNHVAGDFGRCRIADLNNPAGLIGSPGAGFEITDPHTRETYIDTDPGLGDGRLDDCVGEIEIPIAGDERKIEKPDGILDLYTQNPAAARCYLVGNFNEIDYEAFVLELIRRQYRSWEMQASYTWSQAFG